MKNANPIPPIIFFFLLVKIKLDLLVRYYNRVNFIAILMVQIWQQQIKIQFDCIFSSKRKSIKSIEWYWITYLSNQY